MSGRLSKSQVENLQASQVHSTLGRVMLADGFDMVYDLDKSHGMRLHDKVTGKEYLDFFSFFGSWPLSHNHPKIVNDKKFLESIAKVALHNPANSDVYTVEMAQFVATFERVAMPQEFKHLFLIQGGSNAVENALKTAFDWKVRLNLSKGKGEKGKKILHFKEAFHGRGGYTLSLTNTQDPNKYKYFALFDEWPRVSNPKIEFPLNAENVAKAEKAEKAALAHIHEILRKEGDDVAAILLEAVQSEGGDNHFRPEFWSALRDICNKNDVLFIADEVQAGMGLSGKFWAYQHYGAVPDIICFGKKAQVCGIMTTDRIDQVPDNVFKVSSRINSTWGGNLVDMVRSRKFLEIIEEDRLIENAAQVGAYLLRKVEGLQKKYPQLVSNARGKGLIVAFDLPTEDVLGKVKNHVYNNGALLLSCGSTTIRFRPVLDCTMEAVDQMTLLLDGALGAVSSPKASL
ncbi:L-lysine 6-transaminase [Planoprotostelium fungivorum]|uniref:L-lysine-epsilon aminotransferase n=1 Tax=Planoprotostelium fungivorum TaxID=1890364 RepID=A0A2P6NF08_9EUKA|nr:L-lysine 6-transaminase [Planoprotostelium fungivorum]